MKLRKIGTEGETLGQSWEASQKGQHSKGAKEPVPEESEGGTGWRHCKDQDTAVGPRRACLRMRRETGVARGKGQRGRAESEAGRGPTCRDVCVRTLSRVQVMEG